MYEHILSGKESISWALGIYQSETM